MILYKFLNNYNILLLSNQHFIKQRHIFPSMNFQALQPLPRSKQLLDLAFRRAREKAKQPTAKDWLERIKRKESSKLDIIRDYLVGELSKILESWPKQEELNAFYLKLMHLTLDYSAYKKTFGALAWAVQRIKPLHKEYVSKLNKAEEKKAISDIAKQFYGRVSSMIKQMDVSLEYLDECRKILKTYPDVKEMFTVCVYGFPNVGKTTLLNKLTGSKAKVAAYAFTTTTINSGFFKLEDITIQVLDVPGTLARKERMNLIELQAELVLDDLASIIIYVFDLSGYGFPLEKQMELYERVKEKKNVLIYVSKQDVTDKEVLAEFEYQHCSIEELKEKIVVKAREEMEKKRVEMEALNEKEEEEAVEE